jgi:hypothetical protein
MFEKGHQLGRIFLEGYRGEKMELPVGNSKIPVNFLLLKGKKDFLYPRGFVENSIEDVLDEV